ncbi:MAG TPA: lysine 2,3-aminomutase [Bacteroides sp.]|nr:lysine 2,3-aminomutase [Bacteroides sp.]
MQYKAFTRNNFDRIRAFGRLSQDQVRAIRVVSEVLPFKTNNYVVNELIDWDHYEDDPMFILNFPQKDMLEADQFNRIAEMIGNHADRSELARYVNEIRISLNPHPAGQLEHNVPTLKGEKLTGIQHKYRETMLFFPSQGQTCHAYCTFCFRWPQFTGMSELKFAMKQANLLVDYLRVNPAITDILLTGGDPMVMRASVLEKYIDTILGAGIPHLKTIRIGTKSLAFWPYRFLTDNDSEDVLRVFRKITDRGINLAIMAHFSHQRELSTGAVQEAVKKIRSTGAQIRTQSPVLRHINDDPDVWATMWRKQVDMGMIPYYMFVARDTGAQSYFGVNLPEAHRIFTEAYRRVSGVCRTVRGPSMSTGPGKIRIEGIAEIRGEKVFVMNFIQGRNPEWVGIPFFAAYNPDAQWLDDLVPAFGESEFFYEQEYNKLIEEDKSETENRRKSVAHF